MHSLHQLGRVLRWAMRVVLLLSLALLLGGGSVGCKRSKPADTAPPETWNPYKNAAPAKVKADVEKINQQHEDKLDREIENSKNAP
jgi:hypothetical protein